jgi:hypothetical protein
VTVKAGFQSELTIDFPQPGVRTSFYSPEGATVVMTPIEQAPPPVIYLEPTTPTIRSDRIPEYRHTHWGPDPSDPFYHTYGQ